MYATTQGKGPGISHKLIPAIMFTVLLIPGTSGNSDQFYGVHGISDPIYGAPRHSDPVYGVSGTSEPAYGAHGTSEPVYGAHRNSEAVNGAARNSEPIYGAPGHSELIYGAHGTSDPVYGAPRNSVPVYGTPGILGSVYGTPGHSELIYGAPGAEEPSHGSSRSSVPVYGSSGNSGSVYGSPGHSELGYGTHGTSEPVHGPPRSSVPVYGSLENSGSVYGATGISEMASGVHGTLEPFYGTPRNSETVYGHPGNSRSVYGALGNSELASGVHGTSEPVYGTPRNPETVYGPPGNSGSVYGAPENSGVVYGPPGNSGSVYGAPGNSGAAYGSPGNSEVVYGTPGNSELVYGPPGTSGLLYGASGNQDLGFGATEDPELESETTESLDLVSGAPSIPEQNCSSLVGFEAEVPPYAINTTDLSICNSGNFSCCTSEMEEELIQTMENYFIDSLQSNVKELSKFFEKNHHKLVKTFIDAVELNRNESIDLFHRVYGMLFHDGKLFSIYDHIISFYQNGYDEHILTDYFKKQFISLFELMNAHYKFDDKFKKCMETKVDWMEMVSPKDAKELMGGISRSITAVRAYTQGLLVGRDAIRSLMWYEPNQACVKELVRMRGCIQCSGNQGSPICADYCLEVLAICFAKHMDFSNAWADYYYAMQRLQEKIENEYNVDGMISSLSIKLSDLIMDFQENSILIHEKVFGACGKPMHSSRKDASSRVRRYTFLWNKKGRKQGEVYKLIKDIQNNLQISFLNVCKDEQVSEHNCWSGAEVGNYTRDAFPESWRDANKSLKLHPDAIPLRLSTRKLRAAINNHDVKWLDYEHKIFEICWIGS